MIPKIKNILKNEFPNFYLFFFVLKQNFWIFHFLFFYKILNRKSNFFNDDFFKNKRIIVMGPADSSSYYLSSELIDKFDLVVRINDSPNMLFLNKSLGTNTNILYHNLYLNNNPDINEELLISQNIKFVLYNGNAPHLESNFEKSRSKYKKINIVKIHPYYYAFLIKDYCKFNLSPTTGILALNHLIQQEFKELHIVGFTFYKTDYTFGYKGVMNSNLLSYYESIINEKVHNPSKDFDTFLKLYKKYYKNKNIFLDLYLKKIVYENFI
jgi:hypothetical protein